MHWLINKGFTLLYLLIWLVTWPEHKNFKSSRSLHLSPLKPMPMGKVHSDARTVGWICYKLRYWKSYGVTKTWWRHSFFINAILNKSVLQILHLNALYLLALVSTEKDVSCVSLRVFVFWSCDLPNMVMTNESEGNLH